MKSEKKEPVELGYVELHTGFFLASKNFGTKLDTTKITGLKMWFDESSEKIIIEYNGVQSFFHWVNAANIVPKDQQAKLKPVIQHKSHPMTANIATAQVSTPMGHVFQGEGAGKTRQ